MATDPNPRYSTRLCSNLRAFFGAKLGKNEFRVLHFAAVKRMKVAWVKVDFEIGGMGYIF